MGWIRMDVGGARVAFTDRRGGVSAPPYDSLNLGEVPHEGSPDDPAALAANRRVAAEFLATGGGPEAWVPIRQVHGTGVAVCDRVDGVPRRADADAVVVTVPGRTGVILTADCAPVAVVAAGGVAAIHGGWRGLLAGVVSEGVDALRRAAGNPARAVLGACIRPCCYEFGVADLDTVAARFGPEVRSTTRSGAPALDVPAVVRSALSECGVAEVLDLGVCTACSPDSFSFRRDGVTGRQALLIAWTGAWP